MTCRSVEETTNRSKGAHQRCDHERRYGLGRTTKGHSAACRARIVVESSKTLKGSDVFKQQTVASIDPLLNKLKDRIRCPSPWGGGLMR